MNKQRAIQAGTTAAVLLVAVIAAVFSFVHVDHLAVTHGQTVLAAMLLPVSIDGTTESDGQHQQDPGEPSPDSR